MDRNQRFARAVDALRAHGHTQTSMAELLGLSGQSRISEYLRGVREPSEAITRHIELEAGLRRPTVTGTN